MLEIAVLVALSALAEERTVSSLFKDSGRVEVTASGMTIVRAPQNHILVARIDDGGAVATACTTTEKSVQAFLGSDTTRAK